MFAFIIETQDKKRWGTLKVDRIHRLLTHIGYPLAVQGLSIVIWIKWFKRADNPPDEVASTGRKSMGKENIGKGKGFVTIVEPQLPSIGRPDGFVKLKLDNMVSTLMSRGVNGEPGSETRDVFPLEDSFETWIRDRPKLLRIAVGVFVFLVFDVSQSIGFGIPSEGGDDHLWSSGDIHRLGRRRREVLLYQNPVGVNFGFPPGRIAFLRQMSGRDRGLPETLSENGKILEEKAAVESGSELDRNNFVGLLLPRIRISVKALSRNENYCIGTVETIQDGQTQLNLYNPLQTLFRSLRPINKSLQTEHSTQSHS
ncbi:hypothetical protein BDN72DRAFT_862817 [Pluteus cervinus]|uniref:Uncharacterized protein n=1 Tax=Pluteus cervinus TaxID=181527 RepID=A0ACD3AAL0_9AGAR|nr:hypothetical protein BDN72DRAFT_862817 [Pluteus cervinus]